MTTSKSDRLYLQLRRRIAEMRNGEAFPTVRALMTEYGVSQSTVTPAINRLKEQGLLEAHVGRGSFVCKENTQPIFLLLQNNWPNEIFENIRRSYQEAAETAGFRFSYNTFDYRDNVSGKLDQYDADVIVIDGIDNDLLNPEQVLAISHSPVPVILSRNSVPINQINYVCGDNAAAGTTAANYLYRLGHRKLALLINEPHLYTTEAYRRGFENGALSNGCTVEVLDCGMKPGDRCDRQVEAFINDFCRGKYDFTAIFPVSNNGAFLVRKYLEERGRRIPEDLSVISAGSVPRSPWLTTIDSGLEEYKEYIIKMAKQLLNHTGNYKRQVEFRQKLIEGTSVLDLRKQPLVPNKKERTTYA